MTIRFRLRPNEFAQGCANVPAAKPQWGCANIPLQAVSLAIAKSPALPPSRSAFNRARCVATGAGGDQPPSTQSGESVLGDTETGAMATWPTLREAKAGQSRPGGAGNGTTCAQDVGCTHSP